MIIRDFSDSLDYLFKAQLTAFVWGRAGIGKTTVVKEYAKSKGYHFFPLYLGTQSDLGDVLGLADFKRDENGTAIATTFATPEWLKNTIDYCNANPDSGAILFLDEFNRARRDVLQGMFSLALDKTFHTIKLPNNCHIIAAGNPPTEEYYTTDVNDTALMSRFVHIKLEPTLEEFIKYAKATEIEHTLVSFIQEQPDLLEDKHSAFDLPIKVDRRSYERLNRLFQVQTPNALLTQLMQGIIGIERTVAYELHLKRTDKPLSGDEVLGGKGFNKLELWSDPKDIKSSLLTITCDNVYDSIVKKQKATEDEESGLNKKEVSNLIKFFFAVPKDISYVLLVKLFKNECKIYRELGQNKHGEKYANDLVKLLQEAKGTK